MKYEKTGEKPCKKSAAVSRQITKAIEVKGRHSDPERKSNGEEPLYFAFAFVVACSNSKFTLVDIMIARP
jgi:hypothetical protein